MKSFGLNRLQINRLGSIITRIGTGGSAFPSTLTDDFLFYGQLSKIKDGKLYNQIKGTTDYLTVVDDTPGAETFQCPDNATYKTADEDLLWATSGGVINTVTTAELVGLDYYRTVVKFDDTTPYAIKSIGILKTGSVLTATQLNKLHEFFWLWLYWGDVLNGYGHLKSNREIASQPEVLSAQITQAAPTKVAITFDQDLNETQVPDISAFALAGKTITLVEILGPVLTLTVSVTYDFGDVVTVDYTRPTVDPLIGDIVGRRTESFTGQAVTNNISYLLLLADGNTDGLYMYQDTATITQVSNEVSQWNDKLGSGHDLIQATGSKQPTLQATGIRFIRANADFMKAVDWGLIQPTSIYMVVKQVSWTVTTYLFDGNVTNRGRLITDTASPGLSIAAGSPSPVDNGLAVGDWGIVRACFDGAVNSSFQINAGAKWIGNAFTQNMGSIAIGGRGTDGLGSNSDIEVKEIIVRKVNDSDANELAIYNYLKAKYSL